MHPETILADWTFVFYLKVLGGGGGGTIKGRRILMIRELLSCNFWGISTILKAQGTSREIILRLLFFGNVSFSNHYYWKLRYRWHWVIGFSFYLIFSHPSLFLSVLPLPPHLLLCPSHSLQTPPPSSPLPAVHPSSPRLSVDCRGRHWTVNLTPDYIMTRGHKLIMIN